MKRNSQIRKLPCKEAIGWIFILISLVMLGNSIRLCFSNDIWYDELFTVGMFEHSYGELIRFTARDVHPPLYYCITKFVVDLCKLIFSSAGSIMIAKIVSVMPYFLFLIYVLTFLRKRFGAFVAGIFFFCILSMPQMSAYTVEMRMYSWALFFVTATFFHAYEIAWGEYYDKKNDCEQSFWKHNFPRNHYGALVLYGLAAAYTQYFACVAVIMIYVCLLVWFLIRYRKDAARALKGWFVCVGVSVLGYLPWLFVLLSQISAVRENYWILPLTWRSLGGCVKFLMKPAFGQEKVNTVLAVVLFVVYVSMLAIFGYRAYKRKKEKINIKICMRTDAEINTEISAEIDAEINTERSTETDAEINTEIRPEEKQFIFRFFYAMAGCLVLCGLVGFGFLASIVIRPIFVYRYMLPAMGCFWLCFALCLDALTDKRETAAQTILFDTGKRFRRIRGTAFLQMLIVLIVLIVGVQDYRAFMGEEEYKIVLMKETEQAISYIEESDIEKTDVILYNFDQLQAVAGYYLNRDSYLWNGVPEPLIMDMFGNKGTVESTEQIKEWLADGRRVWFFGSFNSREDIRAEWAQDGLFTDELGMNTMLERYWFNIYSVSE